MAEFEISELISRAAVEADMHDNFVNSDTWIKWANLEFKNLVNRIVKLGYPYRVQTELFDAAADIITDANGVRYFRLDAPMALVAFYRKHESGSLEKLDYNHFSTRRQLTPISYGDATEFTYTRTFDVRVVDPMLGVTSDDWIYLYPFPVPSSGVYVLDYIAQPDEITAIDDAIVLPGGWEERIVLGMAKRALTKEETVNPLIHDAIREIDAHIDNYIYDFLMAQQNTVLRIKGAPTPFIFI